jgi:hypothetical protein
MHARELIDLAAVVAVHTPVLLRAARDIPEESVEAYWVASKCRLDRWCRSLKKLSTSNRSGTVAPNSAEHRAFCGLLEEILAGEVLTRVWSAAMCVYDRARGADRMEPVARSVLIGHIEARHRVLTILVGRTGLAAEEAMRLDALRRRTERWTDVLIGYMAVGHDLHQFAPDPDRAAEFAADFAQQRQQEGGRFVWPMVLASIRTTFQEWIEPKSQNPDLNAGIAASILLCFPPEVFDGAGVMQSQWLMRISHVTRETEGMLEELLAEVPSPAVSQVEPASPERFNRWGRFHA